MPSGANDFTVTADMTLYAKWTQNSAVTTTAIYFYSESWTQVRVKPYKGETALFSGEGIVMVAVAGKDNWYKAEIGDTATSVIFTDGEESTASAAFDKNKPYCKDGVWTENIPSEQPVVTEYVVTIKINNGEAQELKENPKAEGEFVIKDIELKEGDRVVITINGEAVANYDTA